MHYHLILTESCNSECRYCYKKSFEDFGNNLDKKFKFDFSCPENLEIGIKKLKGFLEKDKNAVLIFYGGEPLLQIEKIKEIIDNINVPFRMQTNGKLLNKLPLKYLNKIEKILISIDGDRERTDFQKGKGTYNKIVRNLKKVRREGYKGELVARMTISEFPDIYEQVLHLLNLKIFDSIHWQLDAGFYKFDFDKIKFKNFVEEYNESITKLVSFWLNEMEKGKVLKIYPFIGIMESLLKNKTTKLRCGAGHSGYAITTNGKIVACPIMNYIKEFEAGDLDTNPEKLKKFEISGKCLNCKEKDLCGGRCLYENKTELWPVDGQELICKTVKHLIKEIKKIFPEVRELISQGKIKIEDFNYEKYFGPEIIP
ncbi:MAG: TIGR04084 family radical SAM/SPASM domain-containing protein [Candidatus Pacearchaeota archaeon]